MGDIFNEMVVVAARSCHMSQREVKSRVKKVLDVLRLDQAQKPNVLIQLIKSNMNVSMTCSRYYLVHPEHKLSEQSSPSSSSSTRLKKPRSPSESHRFTTAHEPSEKSPSGYSLFSFSPPSLSSYNFICFDFFCLMCVLS